MSRKFFPFVVAALIGACSAPSTSDDLPVGDASGDHREAATGGDSDAPRAARRRRRPRPCRHNARITLRGEPAAMLMRSRPSVRGRAIRRCSRPRARVHRAPRSPSVVSDASARRGAAATSSRTGSAASCAAPATRSESSARRPRKILHPVPARRALFAAAGPAAFSRRDCGATSGLHSAHPRRLRGADSMGGPST